MTFSFPLRRIVGLSLAVAVITFSGAIAQTPTRQEVSRLSASGSYLAGRSASLQRDAAAAATYYRAALRSDPTNQELLDRAFVSVLTSGDIEEAIRLAERLVQTNRNDKIARLVLGVRAIKQRQWTQAKQNISQSVRGQVTDLTAALLTGWISYGAGDAKGGIEAIDKVQGAEWYPMFKEAHAALILDLAGNKKDAAKRFEQAYKLDASSLRLAESYGSFLARTGRKDEALKVYQTFDKLLPRHPLIVAALDELNKNGKISPLVDGPQTGAAEVLYGLGATLGRRGGEDLGLVYLHLSLYLAPAHPLALLTLADLYEAMKKPELAIKTYELMPAKSPLKRNAEIQLAINLDTLERTDEAKAKLEKLIANNPTETDAIMAYGNILRGRKQFAECAEAYGNGIAALAAPEKSNWVIFYFRGICYERSKNWPKAEADLKRALELFPEQPQVLNYLGYSWVDQGINLDEGMKMIRRAVEQRPDDGYIVNSLGWAHYRIGEFEEAVKHLDRAVELKPEDPTINDHLGDAYWRVGRTLEAQFQWSHARDLKPEPDELTKIELKLRNGLTEETAATTEKPKKPGNGG